MKNISNCEIDSAKCTKCPTCGKTSWYILECDCGHIVCEHCSSEKTEDDSDTILITCPKCGNFNMFV
jgi:hypothetical protein